MHENRTPSGPRRSNGMQLLNRQTGSIAPDHPPKHMHAWVIILFVFRLSPIFNIFLINYIWLLEKIEIVDE